MWEKVAEKIYKCDRCGEYFEKPIIHRMEQDTGYIPQTCPNCESEYYSEVNVCRICGKPTDSEADEFCDECKEIVGDHLKNLSNELFFRTQMTEDEFNDYDLRDVLMEYYGIL